MDEHRELIAALRLTLADFDIDGEPFASVPVASLRAAADALEAQAALLHEAIELAAQYSYDSFMDRGTGQYVEPEELQQLRARALPLRNDGSGVDIDTVPDAELPGMWERADFMGGLDEVRPPAASRDERCPIHHMGPMQEYFRCELGAGHDGDHRWSRTPTRLRAASSDVQDQETTP